ncbi:MAG: T9SS type A sorting domain-containing protein, partial [Melioribacteraceae bacterium]|nr:T9SS type A sorting domain-containing protein [Melioribacteraceae bacterium]
SMIHIKQKQNFISNYKGSLKSNLKKGVSTLFLILFSSLLLSAQTRYVSPNGSSTPPYTSWETAAHSIQTAVDASNVGDSILVGNGTYIETIVLKPGNKLIGQDRDSTILDTRTLVTPSDYHAITSNDSCLIAHIHFIVSDTDRGAGIFCNEGVGLNQVINNRFSNAATGILVINSNIDSKLNEFISCKRGVNIIVLSSIYHSSITSNYFSRCETGISSSFPSNLTIRNNTIITKDEFSDGIFCAIADSAQVSNNLVISPNSAYGIAIGDGVGVVNNNLVYGSSKFNALRLTNVTRNINNLVVNSSTGTEFLDDATNNYQFNSYWNVNKPYINGTPDSTNKELYPMFVNPDSMDFRLQKYSPLIDAGDPNILDKDGTRSDIGLYGGPYGMSYDYPDLPPLPPIGFETEILPNQNLVILNWDENREADFNRYIIYKDSLKGFTINENNKYADIDTSYFIDTLFINRNTYYKISGIDNQGNESQPSEEIEVLVTRIHEDGIIERTYKLYQNYPNPFNPTTKISWYLPSMERVRIELFNLLGEKISELTNRTYSSGYHTITLNGSDLSSGVYIYTIRAGQYIESKKMSLIK